MNARLPVLLAAFGAFAGCVTRAELRHAPTDRGDRQVYRAPLDRVRAAARDAVAEAGFTIREDEVHDRYRWRILASQGLSAGTLKRLCRVLLEESPQGVVVFVLVESGELGDTTGTETALQAGIQQRLAARLGGA